MVEELLKYQEVDANLKKIETELMLSQERKNAIIAKKFLDTVEDSVNKLELRSLELNNKFNEASNKLKEFKEQNEEFESALKEIKTSAEGTFLLKKIEEVLVSIKGLTAELNKITADIQQVGKEYSNLKSATEKNKAQYIESGKKYNELKASKEGEMNAIKAELNKLSKNVDSVILEKYLKKRKEKQFPILVEVTDQICPACRMEISLATMSKLKNGEIVECDQCRCLLYKK